MEYVVLHPCSNRDCRQFRTLLRFHKVATNLYAKNGESETALRHIQRKIQLLARSDPDIQTLRNNYLHYLAKASSSGCHYVKRAINKNRFKLALHIIPPLYKIPTHPHPNSINIIYVLDGNLLIEQFSLPSDSIKHVSKVAANEACAGLRQYRNLHRIESLDEPCMFISMRIKESIHNGLSRPLLLPWLFSSLLFLPSCDSTDSDVSTAKPVNFMTIPQAEDIKTVSIEDTEQIVQLANKLRTGEGIDKNEYKAVELYLQAAKQGNAEAQYWLGVMYLDGLGVTDDTDEALYWTAASSDQGYAPAKELLHHMLTTDEVLDC